jgi:hypothetical protein
MNRGKLYSLVILALAAMFDWFFQFTKHSPDLRAIIPFGEDPYDAIGSYCMIVSTLLATLCLLRALYAHTGISSLLQNTIFLARTQLAVALGILITVGTDAIAMARHVSQWTGSHASRELLALVAGIGIVALVVLLLVPRPMFVNSAPLRGRASQRAAIAIAVSIAVLALFPEDLIQSIPLHFLAIVMGDVIVAANQAALLVVLLPFDIAKFRRDEIELQSHSKQWAFWSTAALLGALIGAAALAAELREGAINRLGLVALVYTAAGTSTLMVSFFFLRRPLGLSASSMHG